MVIARAQSFVDRYVPGAPKDAVWGMVKSSAWSFAVAIIITGGDLGAGRRSATLAALASATHTLMTVVFAKLAGSHTISFMAWGTGYLWISKALKVQVVPAVSLFATFIPYGLNPPLPGKAFRCIFVTD
jgi:hypothetical protein